MTKKSGKKKKLKLAPLDVWTERDEYIYSFFLEYGTAFQDICDAIKDTEDVPQCVGKDFLEPELVRDAVYRHLLYLKLKSFCKEDPSLLNHPQFRPDLFLRTVRILLSEGFYDLRDLKGMDLDTLPKSFDNRTKYNLSDALTAMGIKHILRK